MKDTIGWLCIAGSLFSCLIGIVCSCVPKEWGWLEAFGPYVKWEIGSAFFLLVLGSFLHSLRDKKDVVVKDR